MELESSLESSMSSGQVLRYELQVECSERERRVGSLLSPVPSVRTGTGASAEASATTRSVLFKTCERPAGIKLKPKQHNHLE